MSRCCVLDWNIPHLPAARCFQDNHVKLALCALCEFKVAKSQRPWHTLAAVSRTHFLFLPVACYPITWALCVIYSKSWGPDTSHSHTTVIYGPRLLVEIKSHVQEWTSHHIGDLREKKPSVCDLRERGSGWSLSSIRPLVKADIGFHLSNYLRM